MSMKLMSWLGEVEDEIGHAEFRVLFRLCWHCNEQDLLCCPSVEEIVRGSGMSKSSVLRALKTLEERAFIIVERDRWTNGTQKNNRYTVLADVTIKLPGGRIVDLRPTPEQRAARHRVSPVEPGENGRVSNQPGVTGDTSRVSIVTPKEQGSINKEHSPHTLTGMAPSQEVDLLGDQLPIDSRSMPLADYVEAEWSKLAGEYPRIQAMKALNDSRRKKIGARAGEIVREAGGGVTAHDVWDQMFSAIRGSRFLRGEAEPTKQYGDPFSLSIDFVLRPSQFLPILEKAAINAEHNAVTSDPRTGRRYGPAEQAGRAALERFLASQARR